MGLTAASIYDLKLAFGDLSTQLKRNVLRSEGEVAVIIVGPMLFTNILSTSFIAWKAWYVVWFLVSVLTCLHDNYPPTSGITAKLWVHTSGRVGPLGALRKFSGF